MTTAFFGKVGADAFQPHDFRTRIEFRGPPRTPVVVFSAEAMEYMEHLVDLAPEEVSWFGIVKRQGRDTFFVEKIFLVEQHCSEVKTRTLKAALGKLIERLSDEGYGDIIEVNRLLKLWGHSHVRMNVSASPRDEEEMQAFAESSYAIRLIANKHGDLSLSVYFSEGGERLVYDNVPWRVRSTVLETGVDIQALHAEVASVLRPISVETRRKLNLGRKPYVTSPLQEVKKMTPNEAAKDPSVVAAIFSGLFWVFFLPFRLLGRLFGSKKKSQNKGAEAVVAEPRTAVPMQPQDDDSQ